MMSSRHPTTWVALAFAAVLMAATDARSDSMDRYDPGGATKYMGDCLEQGTDRRVCACAVNQTVNDRGRPSTPSVDAGPPTREASAKGYESHLVICMRSARALGLIEH